MRSSCTFQRRQRLLLETASVLAGSHCLFLFPLRASLWLRHVLLVLVDLVLCVVAANLSVCTCVFAVTNKSLILQLCIHPHTCPRPVARYRCRCHASTYSRTVCTQHKVIQKTPEMCHYAKFMTTDGCTTRIAHTHARCRWVLQPCRHAQSIYQPESYTEQI